VSGVLIETRPATDPELATLVTAQQRELRDPTLRWETGTYLPAAISLYRSCGYPPIGVYGEYVGNPFSVCFEKHLELSHQ
jgi:hypothetical protein